MNKYIKLVTLGIFISSINTFSQVGINNMNPQATLDITASNLATPLSTDGIIIPRINNFPTTNPGTDQHSMLVYLTTAAGSNPPGFYFWNNPTTSWLPLGGDSSPTFDWFEENTTTIPNAITDNIYTNGNVAIGGTGTLTPHTQLDIQATNQATPSNTDGILIPRINAFPATNPGADQNSMLVYLTTNQTVGSDTYEPGFYFWKNTITTWIRLDESAWKEVGTDNPLNDSNKYIYTEKGISIGQKINDGRLSVSSAFGDTRVVIDANRDGSQTSRAPRLWFQIEKEDQASGSTGKYRFASIALDGASGGNITSTSNAHDLIFSSKSNDVGFQFIPGENPTLTIAPSGQITLHEYAGAASTTPIGPGTGFTGTAVSILALDVDGNIIQEPLSATNTDTQDLSIDNAVGDLSLVDGGTVEIKTISDSDDDTLIQVEESVDEDIIRFDVEGNEAITLDAVGRISYPGSNKRSIFIGQNAGLTDDGTDNQNIFIGHDSGSANTTGFVNVAIGKNALLSNTDGFSNIAMGTSALKNLASGRRNTAIGHSSLTAATSGDSNTGIGAQTLWRLTTGEANTAVGYGALGFKTDYSETTAVGVLAGYQSNGTQNVLVGNGADYYNRDSDRNVVIGYKAGIPNITSVTAPPIASNLDNRVIIGFEAGSKNTQSNALIIESSNSNSPLIGGDFSNNRVSINKNISNLNNLTHTLNVGGSIKVDTLINIKPGTTPSTPNEGDVYFDSTLKKLRCYDGTTWNNLF